MCKLYFIYYKGDIKSDKSMDICILIIENLNWSGGFFSVEISNPLKCINLIPNENKMLSTWNEHEILIHAVCNSSVCFLCVWQESDGEKSDDNLVVDVSNEVQNSFTAWRLLCYLIKKQNKTKRIHLTLTHHRIRRLPEEVLPTHLGRTAWTSVACWRRMLRWVLPLLPPPAAHLHPNPKR